MQVLQSPKECYPVRLGNLAGPEGNAFCIMGNVKNCLKQCDVDQSEIDALITKMTEDDYEHLVRTVFANCDVLDNTLEELENQDII